MLPISPFQQQDPVFFGQTLSGLRGRPIAPPGLEKRLSNSGGYEASATTKGSYISANNPFQREVRVFPWHYIHEVSKFGMSQFEFKHSCWSLYFGRRREYSQNLPHGSPGNWMKRNACSVTAIVDWYCHSPASLPWASDSWKHCCWYTILHSRRTKAVAHPSSSWSLCTASLCILKSQNLLQRATKRPPPLAEADDVRTVGDSATEHAGNQQLVPCTFLSLPSFPLANLRWIVRPSSCIYAFLQRFDL